AGRQSGGNTRARARHHGSGQRYASLGANSGANPAASSRAGQRQPRRARALEGQRYG
ncbi:hypothetical protein, partial [Mycobacterium avium]